jgi:hypothetical protein
MEGECIYAYKTIKSANNSCIDIDPADMVPFNEHTHKIFLVVNDLVCQLGQTPLHSNFPCFTKEIVRFYVYIILQV